MRISLFYNLREDFPDAHRRTADSDADWDEPETMEGIANGLRDAGHEVADIGDPRQLLDAKVQMGTDLVFSMCEMRGLRHREAIVPALCELLGLPYAFSPPDVMVTALDKNIANLLVRQAGGHVPDWFVAGDDGVVRDDLGKLLRGGPAIVKPVAEGGGMGVSPAAIVRTEAAMWKRVKYVLSAYRQPAIVQRLVEGPELTVGVVETETGPVALQPMEVTDVAGSPLTLHGHEQKERAHALVRWRTVTDEHLATEARTLALLAFRALGCRDAARFDLRHDAGMARLGFLEANPLPHLHPEVGDFCRSATAAGWSYPALLEAIVANAIRRQIPDHRGQ